MKTQTTFTPGPWRIGSRIESDNTLEIDDNTKASPLAYVSPRPNYDDSQIANARLIASAPELLEALQDFDVWLISPSLSKESLRAMQQKARSAIDKATGGKE